LGLSAAQQFSWSQLSSRSGDLPAPGNSTQQTASLVLDIDLDGINDFVIGAREKAPALVWYRRGPHGWTKFAIDKEFLPIEAGGAFHDIDRDGDLDIVMGDDASGNKIYWWENPYPRYDPESAWTRRFIKESGGKKHHDQIFGDFDGDGKAELVFWNQGERRLYLAEIPDDPKAAGAWRSIEIFSWESGECEGLTGADIDGDGKLDIVGGGRWFKHEGGTRYTAHLIDETQRFSRAAAGQLKKGGSPEVVFVVGDGVGRLKWYEWSGASFTGHDLMGEDVIHGHSLAVADCNNDGNLDIFCAEMARWTRASSADHPEARSWILLGDGQGHFTRTLVSKGFGNHESRVADLDGDGDLDILSKPYSWDTPRIDVWINQIVKSASYK
jgi:hypothetical protein